MNVKVVGIVITKLEFKKCIKIFSDELNLKGLIVGRSDCHVNVINKSI